MALLGTHKIPCPKLTVESATRIKSGWMKIDKKPKNFTDFDWLYEGQLWKGRANGFGVLTKAYKNGTMKKEYSGGWTNGKKQGFGGLWLDNGSYYEGDFCQGKRHGFGRFWHCNGNFYQGTWMNGFYEGNGMLVQANGNRYEGNFVRGKRDGPGVFYHLLSGQIQEGYWSEDICKSGTITDIYWRQSALQPTPYPIPKLGKYVRRDETLVS